MTAIPTVPQLPVGYVAQASDMNGLVSVASFLLNKPVSRVSQVSTAGQAVTTTGTAITFDTANINQAPAGFTAMWSSGANTQLVVSAPGWYKIRYGVCVATAVVISTWVQETTGANNPLGSGVNVGPHWPGYAGTGVGGQGGCSGIWPVYLYAGDVLQVFAKTYLANNTTGTSPTNSFFSAEWVHA